MVFQGTNNRGGLPGDNVSHPSRENTPVGAVKAFLGSLLPQCTKGIYYWPLYLQPALEEGSTIVVVELNILNFSYFCPKLSLVGSCMSVSVVHVEVIQELLARNPSAICCCNGICSSWLQLTILHRHLRHQGLYLSIFFSSTWPQICYKWTRIS